MRFILEEISITVEDGFGNGRMWQRAPSIMVHSAGSVAKRPFQYPPR